MFVLITGTRPEPTVVGERYSGRLFAFPSFSPIPRPERFLMAFSLRSGCSTLRAGAMKRSGAKLTNLAPRFPAERTNPSVDQRPGWLQDFRRHRLGWLNSATGGRQPVPHGVPAPERDANRKFLQHCSRLPSNHRIHRNCRTAAANWVSKYGLTRC